MSGEILTFVSVHTRGNIPLGKVKFVEIFFLLTVDQLQDYRTQVVLWVVDQLVVYQLFQAH